MSFEEAEIIKTRAYAFLRNAERLINEGEWDLAMFSLEQFCQLVLKYKFLVRRGSYPRTHSLRALIRIFSEVDSKVLELIEDERNLHYIARIEEAYIVARYLPYVFEEKEVKSVYKFVVEAFKPLVEKL